MNSTARTLIPTLVAALVLSSCGGGDDDPPTGTGSDPTGTSSSAPTGSATPGTPTGDPTSTAGESKDDTDFGTPAKGAQINGTGYSFRIPVGWVDTTERARAVQSAVDTAGGEQGDTDGFSDSVYVGFDEAEGATLDLLERSIPITLAELVKPSELERLPRVRIKGVDAIHHRGPAQAATSSYFLEQFVTLDDDGKLVIITFSFSRKVAEAARTAKVNAVLASWAWA